MRKHVREYYRRRHGTSEHGGEVSDYYREGNFAIPNSMQTPSLVGGYNGKEKWAQEAISDVDTGWKKTDTEKTRRARLLAATDHRKPLRERYLESARRIQAISNVTKDAETKTKGKADADYYYAKARKTRAGKYKKYERKDGKMLTTEEYKDMKKDTSVGIIIKQHQKKKEGKYSNEVVFPTYRTWKKQVKKYDKIEPTKEGYEQEFEAQKKFYPGKKLVKGGFLFITTSERVKKHQPIEVWEAPGWKWEVYKKYQKPEKEAVNPYARWHVKATSPIMPEGEFGDEYVQTIKKQAKKTYEEK